MASKKHYSRATMTINSINFIHILQLSERRNRGGLQKMSQVARRGSGHQPST